MLPFKWHKGFDENSLPEIASADLPIPIVQDSIRENTPKVLPKVGANSLIYRRTQVPMEMKE